MILFTRKDNAVVKKKEKWEIVNVRFLGLYVSGPCAGPGWGNPGYYHAIYEIDEIEINSHKYRTTFKPGETQFVGEVAVGEGYFALENLFKIYSRKANLSSGLPKKYIERMNANL